VRSGRSPLAYWRQRGIPVRVIEEAIDWCFFNCEPLRLPRVLGMLQRRLRNWEALQQRLLFRRILPHLRPEGYIGISTYSVLQDESGRKPGKRHPEAKGFEMDHPEARKEKRWQRFERRVN
jgi:hypothetical protein